MSDLKPGDTVGPGPRPSNAAAWAIHDVIVHPLTGCLGVVGRLLGSPRIMALAHHLHNATAPSNDAWADYADAAKRAGCNEAGIGRYLAGSSPRPNDPVTIAAHETWLRLQKEDRIIEALISSGIVASDSAARKVLEVIKTVERGKK